LKNLVRVEILGREYNVRSDEGEERVRKIAEYVDQKIKEITEGAKTISTINVAILAALNIADDYFRAVEDQNLLSRTVKNKSVQLIAMIDSKINREG
jgi:cell division protein ZapA